ncbi:MAG: asparagine synthase-related protein [Planctomycetota bacterium]
MISLSQARRSSVKCDYPRFAGALTLGPPSDSPGDLRLLGRPFSLASNRCLGPDDLARLLLGSDVPSACRDLDGSFCVAVHEPRDSALHLISDPVATFPILYALVPEGALTRVLYAASWEEMLALLSRHGVRPRLNWRAAAKFMFSGYVWDDETLLEGVRVVEPGAVLTINAHGAITRRYFLFRRRPERRWNVSSILAPLEDVLSRHRGRKILLALSGGWDSRTLLALACRLGLPLETITLGCAQDQLDDLGVAVMLSHLAEVPHHRWLLKPDDFPRNADRLIRASGGMCDALVSYSDGLARFAEVASAFDVVLRGDECFGWGTTSLSARHAKKQLGLRHLPPPDVRAPELQKLFLDELDALDFGRPDGHPDDVKNEFYWRRRLPRYIMPVAHWQRLAAPQAQIEHPCLARPVLEAVALAPRPWTNDKRCERELLRAVAPSFYRVPFPQKKCWCLSNLFRDCAGLRDYLLDHVTCPSLLDDLLPLADRRRLADSVGKPDPDRHLDRGSPSRASKRLFAGLKRIPALGTVLGNLYALKSDALAVEGLPWLIRSMCIKVFMDAAQA